MSREYYLRNLEGTLYYKDIALFEFRIVNRELIYWKDLSNKELWPPEPKVYGMSYGSLNEFFNRRVVQDNAMLLSQYLKQMGLQYYDFEELVKKNNGSTHDFYWVKFKDFGARNFSEICTQNYPVY